MRIPSWACLALLLTACSKGAGSDIGPDLRPLPDYDYRVLVRDDSGRPVSGALVSLDVVSTTATTGRTGRAFLREFASGPAVLQVDGTAAAAEDSSRLGRLRLAVNLPDGSELPQAFHLPDYQQSVGLNLSTGVQGAPASLDDTAAGRSGALLNISAGDNLSLPGASAVTLYTADLAAGHLPASLSSVAGSPQLCSRGFYIHPPELRFANGAQLSVPDELNLSPAQVVRLWRLDPATGVWQQLGTASESGGRIVTGPNGIPSGGLFCFSLDALTTTEIRGRVRDLDGNGVFGALIASDQAHTRAGGDGRFVLPLISRGDAAGTDRSVVLEIDGGRSWLPVRKEVNVSLNAPSLDLGDISFDSRLSTSARILMINRGAQQGNTRLRISGRQFFQVGSDLSDGSAEFRFEDQISEVVGWLYSVPKDKDVMLRAQGLQFLHADTTDNHFSVFARQVLWRPDAQGGTLAQVVDAYGKGPIYEADLIIGDVPGEGYQGKTDFNGYRAVGVPRLGVVTAVMQSQKDGRTVTSAFSLKSPDSGRLEMPLQRALRQGLGAFRRFGMVAGSVANFGGAGKTIQLHPGAVSLQDWFETSFLGMASDLDTPRQVEPSAASPGYRVGLPEGVAALAAAAGTEAGGVFTLERLGLQAGIAATPGQVLGLDLSLDASVGQTFTLGSALSGLDAGIPLADLRFDLAAELPGGLVLDLARSVGGNHSAAGNDAQLNLPAIPAGVDRYLLSFGGSVTAGGTTSTQQIFARVDGSTPFSRAQLPLPTITSPAAGVTLPGTGFVVGFTLPSECHYAVLNLRSETATDVRDWTVVMPWERDQFRFFQFPSEVPQLLVPGRTWTLTLRCVRIDEGLLIHPELNKNQTFARAQANYVGLPESRQGAGAFSSVSRSFSTN